MGGAFDSRVYYNSKNELTKEKVEQLFKDDQESSAYESGHSYSGAIGVMPSGIKWLGVVYKTEAEVREYIEEHHSKWDQAMGAKFDGGYFVGGWCSS